MSNIKQEINSRIKQQDILIEINININIAALIAILFICMAVEMTLNH